MFISVMVVFVLYAIIFILFEDYDRRYIEPFEEASDWHLLLFSVVVMMRLPFLSNTISQSSPALLASFQASQPWKSAVLFMVKLFCA